MDLPTLEHCTEHLCTYFNAINSNMNGVETNCSWSPISTVSTIIVDSYQHVFTWSMKKRIVKLYYTTRPFQP